MSRLLVPRINLFCFCLCPKKMGIPVNNCEASRTGYAEVRTTVAVTFPVHIAPFVSPQHAIPHTLHWGAVVQVTDCFAILLSRFFWTSSWRRRQTHRHSCSSVILACCVYEDALRLLQRNFKKKKCLKVDHHHNAAVEKTTSDAWRPPHSTTMGEM